MMTMSGAEFVISEVCFPGWNKGSVFLPFFNASGLIGIKKGIPLYPNLVNLKSNTMKNTMQKYGFAAEMQENEEYISPVIIFFHIVGAPLSGRLDNYTIKRKEPVFARFTIVL